MTLLSGRATTFLALVGRHPFSTKRATTLVDGKSDIFVIPNQNLVTQCLPFTLTWAGGQAPFAVGIFPGDQPNGLPLQQYNEITSSSFVWSTNITGGTSICFKLVDSAKETIVTPVLIIQPSSDNSCLVGDEATSPKDSPSSSDPNSTSSSTNQTPRTSSSPSEKGTATESTSSSSYSSTATHSSVVDTPSTNTASQSPSPISPISHSSSTVFEPSTSTNLTSTSMTAPSGITSMTDFSSESLHMLSLPSVTTATPQATKRQHPSTSPISIAGIVIGGLALLFIFATVVLRIRRANTKKTHKRNEDIHQEVGARVSPSDHAQPEFQDAAAPKPPSPRETLSILETAASFSRHSLSPVFEGSYLSESESLRVVSYAAEPPTTDCESSQAPELAGGENRRPLDFGDGAHVASSAWHELSGRSPRPHELEHTQDIQANNHIDGSSHLSVGRRRFWRRIQEKDGGIRIAGGRPRARSQGASAEGSSQATLPPPYAEYY